MRKRAMVFSFLSLFALILSLVLNLKEIGSWLNNSPVIKGEWRVDFLITSSSYRPFVDMKIAYKMHFRTDKGVVIGSGEKWWLNDEELPFREHDPLLVSCTAVNDSLFCTYELIGSQRTSSGSFSVECSANNEFSGTFSGTAANATGVVFGKKIK